MVRFLESAFRTYRDYDVVEDGDSFFNKFQELIRRRGLLKLTSLDQIDSFSMHPSLLGHSLVRIKSPQLNSYQIVDADVEIRGALCISEDTKNLPLKVDDIVAISLAGKLSQDLDPIKGSRNQRSYFFKSLKLSARRVVNSQDDIAFQYFNLEPYVQDEEAENETWIPSDNESDVTYFHNMHDRLNYMPRFMHILERTMSQCFPKDRLASSSYTHENLRRDLLKNATNYKCLEKRFEFPDSSIYEDSIDYHNALIEMYKKQFGFPTS